MMGKFGVPQRSAPISQRHPRTSSKKSYKFGDFTKKGVKKVSMIRHASEPEEDGSFPEFHLICMYHKYIAVHILDSHTIQPLFISACGHGSSGSVTYVAQNSEEIAKFEKVVDTCRFEQLQGDVRSRGETLGSLKQYCGQYMMM